MSPMPKKCLIDTNVPITANRALDPKQIPDELIGCVEACVNAIEYIVKKGGLVIDSGNEIFDEYRRQLSMKGQPGVGDKFMKWVHDNGWNGLKADRVEITKNGASYDEFPDHIGLTHFDNSDRKFIAVSNAHPDKPPILQATDSKWWGWKDDLDDVGITVYFLCPEYIKAKFAEKIGM
ncbi:MAG: hypothetical protein ETSY1_38540 [Candidatus Entotheonella factor]|uniref:Uncharacterized protein n=1 Tax=Entotheonella factor TaxID=1429438 RepID=W4L665_ENTF1|nr:MAG: hypothetical protein ETSY1_38540 [Candidatus Entotheonella factor]